MQGQNKRTRYVAFKERLQEAVLDLWLQSLISVQGFKTSHTVSK